MKILVAGATGSIGIHVVNTAIAMGHQPVALVRNRRKIKLLPRGTDIFYGDVSIPETLTDLPKDIDAIIFTLGSDGQGRIGARAIVDNMPLTEEPECVINDLNLYSKNSKI
ncbi:TPA: NAD(P)H-binding protein [Escherichia coli]|nr:NAD(P)H-binding protein [Escherichia coli]